MPQLFHDDGHGAEPLPLLPWASSGGADPIDSRHACVDPALDARPLEPIEGRLVCGIRAHLDKATVRALAVLDVNEDIARDDIKPRQDSGWGRGPLRLRLLADEEAK